MNSFPLIRRPFRYRFYNATLTLIAINCLVFIMNSLFPDTRVILSMNPLYVVKGGAFWQVFTYMFVHADVSHLLVNMLGLFFFGAAVEHRMGSSEFLLFYLLTGTLAGLFSLGVYAATSTWFVMLLGASGAIFAVLLAFATLFPTENIYIWGLLPVRAPILVLLYAGVELVSQFFSIQSGVAHLTHLAGFLFAYLYLVLRIGLHPFREFRRR
jgi:membrane associated rhomboid family serine protease